MTKMEKDFRPGHDGEEEGLSGQTRRKVKSSSLLLMFGRAALLEDAGLDLCFGD